jgi:hypothetical protein
MNREELIKRIKELEKQPAHHEGFDEECLSCKEDIGWNKALDEVLLLVGLLDYPPPA